MARYWAIAPYNSGQTEIWERAWKYDLANNTIAIGWNELGRSARDKQQLKNAIENHYVEKSKASKTWLSNIMWQFYNKIAKDDIVISRRGRKQIAAIGTVVQTAYYDEEKGHERVGEAIEDFHANFIGVQWHEQPRNRRFDHIVFGMQTVYEIPEDKYKLLVSEDEEKKDRETEFVLEKYLEDFIVSNFNRIFNGKLELFNKDDEDNNGQQYTTGEVGNIDILARELDTGSLVVIELKKGRESDKVIGQILRYMGWVKEKLCKGDQQVKGIIICREGDARLNYALKMMSNIELKRYSIDFKLT